MCFYYFGVMNLWLWIKISKYLKQFKTLYKSVEDSNNYNHFKLESITLIYMCMHIFYFIFKKDCMKFTQWMLIFLYGNSAFIYNVWNGERTITKFLNLCPINYVNEICSIQTLLLLFSCKLCKKNNKGGIWHRHLLNYILTLMITLSNQSWFHLVQSRSSQSRLLIAPLN